MSYKGWAELAKSTLMKRKHMEINAWRKRKKQWERFAAWEAEQKSALSPAEALHQVGEFVDFYFKRHGSIKKNNLLGPEHVQGIIQMHQLLGRWKGNV